MKAFETAAEVIGWIKILIAPLAIGLVLGWIIYYNMQNIPGIILGSLVAAAGFILGIYFANKAWKDKRGTAWLATRHMHSPDLDEEGDSELRS